MTNLTKTIEARSDILNADDLIGGPITIKVTKVSLCAGEQPISINFEGDNKKPFMPCKTVRRLLVHCWGPDGASYVGRSMTLFRDDTVVYAGQNVGGVRVSHMSHITSPITVALTATKKSKKAVTVQPLIVEEAPVASPEQIAAAEDAASIGTKRLEEHWKALSKPDQLLLKPHMEKMKKVAAEADKPIPNVSE